MTQARQNSLSKPRSNAVGLRLALISPALLVLMVGVVGPITLILIYSFLTPGTYGGVEWNFSTDGYVQFLFERDIFDETLQFSTGYLEIFARSFGLAILSVVLCLLIGFPTAYFIATRPPSRRMLWVFLITVPYWVNLLIRTLSLLFLIRDEGPINSLVIGMGFVDSPIGIAYTYFAVALGLVYSYLPFMILPIYAALDRADPSLIEAAFDLYAKKWTVLKEIVIPLAKPGIMAGSLLVFIPSIGSYLAPNILGGGRNLLIGNLIALQFQSSRNWPFGSALAIVLLTMALITLIIIVRRGASFNRVEDLR